MKNILAISASIIGIVLLYFAYTYLVKIEDCLCAQGLSKSEENKANITHLKYIELFLLVVALLNLFFAFKKQLTPLLSTIFFIVTIILYVIFVMNVYKLYRNIPNDCECALQWPRYYIYIQSLLFSITLLLVFITIFLYIYNVHKIGKSVKMKK
jgi:hypothetical protein